MGVYAIAFPLANSATKPAVFSAPLFWVSAWPVSLIAIGRHEMLLTIKAPPAVWRLLLDAYPGEEAILEFTRGELDPGLGTATPASAPK